MISQALKEVRYHPGRVVATIVAIAISIGFLSTISIFLRTQGTAEGKRQAIYSTRAVPYTHLTLPTIYSV